METAGSETTGRKGLWVTAKHWWLLPTVAALAILTTAGVISERGPASLKAESVATSTRRIPAPLRAAGVREGGQYRLITRLGRLSVLRSPEDHGHSTSHAEQDIRDRCALGTHVFLVGKSIDESSIAGWNRGFTSTLPCTSIERSCGANGTILVSSPDGIHFCTNGTPSNQDINGPCDKTSSGAFRFVLATATAVTQCPQPTPALLA